MRRLWYHIKFCQLVFAYFPLFFAYFHCAALPLFFAYERVKHKRGAAAYVERKKREKKGKKSFPRNLFDWIYLSQLKFDLIIILLNQIQIDLDLNPHVSYFYSLQWFQFEPYRTLIQFSFFVLFVYLSILFFSKKIKLNFFL